MDMYSRNSDWMPCIPSFPTQSVFATDYYLYRPTRTIFGAGYCYNSNATNTNTTTSNTAVPNTTNTASNLGAKW
jgi:hypothetical protein